MVEISSLKDVSAAKDDYVSFNLKAPQDGSAKKKKILKQHFALIQNGIKNESSEVWKKTSHLFM